ncbi:unnamed protein product [Mytilus coruscus]|uniref:Reverse transcriptase domain-containing protein n=1 Tax=Mytilus coruscus TaxID=42192 RepID=A0A6J8F062_MYTCO|nr:unnamed protein product [Mytilus coruscus]
MYFPTKVVLWLCKPLFRQSRLENFIFAVTTVWIGYDLLCLAPDVDKNYSEKSDTTATLLIPLFCFFIALYYPLLNKIIENASIKNHLERVKSIKGMKLTDYKEGDLPFGYRRIILKYFFQTNLLSEATYMEKNKVKNKLKFVDNLMLEDKLLLEDKLKLMDKLSSSVLYFSKFKCADNKEDKDINKTDDKDIKKAGAKAINKSDDKEFNKSDVKDINKADNKDNKKANDKNDTKNLTVLKIFIIEILKFEFYSKFIKRFNLLFSTKFWKHIWEELGRETNKSACTDKVQKIQMCCRNLVQFTIFNINVLLIVPMCAFLTIWFMLFPVINRIRRWITPKETRSGDTKETKLTSCCTICTETGLIIWEIDTNQSPLLGFKASHELGLIHVIMTVQTDVDDPVKSFPKVFTGLGCLEKPYHIKIDSSVSPVINPPRKIPAALREKLKGTLKEMEDKEVIRKVDEPTDWVNSLVVVEKPKTGKLRICLDPRNLNKAIKREHFALPTIEDITTRLTGAKYLSELDCNNGYWQLRMDKESQLLTTFNSPFGRYCFLRMPFGIKSAQEVFQKRVSQLFENLKGVETDIDDILVWGTTRKEHDDRLRSVLNRCQEVGLTLNAENASFESKM